jgi:hypothetical protein
MWVADIHFSLLVLVVLGWPDTIASKIVVIQGYEITNVCSNPRISLIFTH